DVGGAGGVEGAGEGVAITFVQVGVGVTQIQREHLVGEADADVPGVVVLVGDTVGENGADAGAVEGVRSSEPLPAELTRHVHAHAGGTEGRAGRGVLGGQRSVVAPGARVQEVRRIILGRADRDAVVDGV